MYTGENAPDESLGVDGDMYLQAGSDLPAPVLFGPKHGGKWARKKVLDVRAPSMSELFMAAAGRGRLS